MKLKNFFNRIPRPLKACICAILVIVLAIAYYIALGCPTLTFQQEFRRAEKAHLVGPSTIVDTMNREYNEFDKMIVSETEEGICFFGRYYDHYPYSAPFAEKQYLFSYVEKTGDLTIAAAPNVWGPTWSFTNLPQQVPVYLFTEEQDAVRAEVEITVPGDLTKHTFQADADRLDSGVFLFWFEADTENGLSALYFFSYSTGGHKHGWVSDEELAIVFPATVRLYDESENLIQETELEIRPQR